MLIHKIKPNKLIDKTCVLEIMPCVKGRYGDDIESVSVWKQSVRACPKPYERKDARNIKIDFETDKLSMKEIPQIPVTPETNKRYGLIVKI
jgi:hypothetical protein